MTQEMVASVIKCLRTAYLLNMPAGKADRAPNVHLRLEREQRGWSQKQVGAAIGTNAVMVSRWECGAMKPGPHFRQRLCAVYDRTPEELGFVPAAEVSAAVCRPEVWRVPRRNGYFTGRESFLERLHEALGARTPGVPQAVTGLAGVGKTQSALEYAHRWSGSYRAVLWADATSRESLTADFVAFAEALELPVGPDEEPPVVVAAVQRWLEQHTGWLLVLDNVDDLAAAEAFLPPGQGSVVLTMRAQASGTVAEGIELEAMPSEEAVLFLLRRAKAVPPDGRVDEAPAAERHAAEQIASDFGGLPLALDQAGAYVEETDCGLAGYLARYRTQQGELLRRRGAQARDHPASIAATFALAFSQVERAGVAAADVLRLSAFLHPDGIPEELFGSESVPGCADQLAFDSALEVLRRYSMVRRDPTTRTVSVHRLVQAVVRGTMDQDERSQWAERAVGAIDRVVPDIQTATWRGVQRYAQQALRGVALVDEWELHSPEAARLLDQMGTYLRDHAQSERAESLLRQAVAMRASLHGPDHPLTATSVANLGRLALDAGRYEESADLYRRALDVRERALGPDHADVADALTGLARVLYDQGRYAEGEPLLRRALEVHEHTVGPDHPQTATTLNTLGMVYRTLARWEEAEPLLRRALAIREREMGPDHPLAARVLNNLAIVLADCKRYDEVEALYRRALAVTEQAMGPDHPSLAVYLHNLAGLHRDRGELDVAESLYRRSLAIRERTMGPDHPTIANHLTSLATILEKEGRLDEADAAAQRALAIWRRTPGGDNEYSARTLGLVARIAAGRGDLTEAAGLLEQAIAISRQKLGAAHFRTTQLEAEYAELLGGQLEAC
jgi:tetratricopeptide (TPR) repeat protein/transcriptional regulator with XRE-family HTH domain